MVDFTVGAFEVIDNELALGIGNIGIDIWRRGTFGINKAFEEKPEGDRIDASNIEKVSDERAADGTAPAPDIDPVAPTPIDEIGIDDHIIEIAATVENAQFEIGSVEVFFRFKAFGNETLFDGIDGGCGIDLDGREMPFAESESDLIALIGDRLGVVDDQIDIGDVIQVS